jgi:16S rRNA (cytosine1402-N4)-methyltransferase
MLDPHLLAADDRAPRPMNAFHHAPVLLSHVLEMAQVAQQSAQRLGLPEVIVDCTVGGAGHACAVLQAAPQARFIGIDRDPQAVATATARLLRFGPRATVVHATLAQLPEVLAAQKVPHVSFLLADFGVSSHQIDTADRGFSFRPELQDSPLDMRMDPTAGLPAWELLERLDEAELARAIAHLGEERRGHALARAIKADRPRTTHGLAALVRRVLRAGSSRKSTEKADPATRTFQALRMLVNDELGQIEALMQLLPQVLANAGVVAAISFHSLEDRAVKHALRAAARGCICPQSFPVCICHHTPTLQLLTGKARVADPQELATNPRARSARLRAAQRCSRGLP